MVMAMAIPFGPCGGACNGARSGACGGACGGAHGGASGGARSGARSGACSGALVVPAVDALLALLANGKQPTISSCDGFIDSDSEHDVQSFMSRQSGTAVGGPRSAVRGH